ncbi:Ppx/GppA phosphatase family protein [Micromonospora sp. CPCC 206061]|uniref:Ppx/GppA phosphatase family protein n=1 Tax=Micromonospora sp. CPCC 206061 TaxID=3122410 RepID=UPI002FF18A22
MRLGVLDVGSNTAHLLVADAGGGLPLPVHAKKTKLRLAERVNKTGTLSAGAIDRLATAVAGAVGHARNWAVQELFGYATAAVRDAPNRDAALAAVRERAGIELGLLDGAEEAELTFLAARRWMGWRAGPLLLLDIGGGSLEIAYGHDVAPDFAVSLPLGAGRLTRERLSGDPPSQRQVRSLRDHVRAQLEEVAVRLHWERRGTVVATSRTFHQLARLCGAPARKEGPFVPRMLRRADLKVQMDRLARMSEAQRARLPGISAPRARQSLAGAIVAHSAMAMLGLREVQVCPWALREGVLLRRVESTDAWTDRALRLGVHPPRPAAPSPPPSGRAALHLVDQGQTQVV